MTETTSRAPARRTVLALIIVALVVVVAGVVTAAVRHDGGNAPHRTSGGPGSTPLGAAPRGLSAAAAGSVSARYYAAVKQGNARAAYALLCPAQQVGFSEYDAELVLDIHTETGVTLFRLTGTGQVRGQQASVPASISLANGEKTPIDVLLSAQAGSWRVCSSNLGGVLPPPGRTPGGATPSASPGVSI